MKIRCLIIDDKPLAIDVLAAYAAKIPFLELAGSTTNPVYGLSFIREQNIDLVFLDIQMPELNGLQFIKVAGTRCKVILTTAYAKYALDGFEHDVIDYLLKPISFERFIRASEKAYQILEKNPVNKNAPAEISAAQQTEYLFIKTEHRIQKINIDDILFIEGLQNYITIRMANGRILSLQTLKKIEQQLPAMKFKRVHKSYIIALRHITSIERSRVSIGSDIIPIGDNYREGFYKAIGGV